MSWHFPTTETVHSGPTGTVATAADFASYLGGIEDVATATVQLDLMIASATARIEQVLGYSLPGPHLACGHPRGQPLSGNLAALGAGKHHHGHCGRRGLHRLRDRAALPAC